MNYALCTMNYTLMTTPILFNLNDSELEQFVAGFGQPRFRAKQIREWLDRGAPDFASMKNLPETLRRDLDATAQTLPVRIVQKLESSDGATTKFLLELAGGEQIETVLMRTTYGNSVCVSSQAGCAMGCKFCASTLLGLKRNLTANEMYAQVLTAKWELQSSDVTHIVVMGTGEPLMNTDALIEFIERAHADLNIGMRRITVSTCGIVPGIEKLTEWGKPVNLAISLHAPTDELRSVLMPINNKYKIAEVLDAAFRNADKNNRQLMIEYILLESEERRAQSLDINSDKLKDNKETSNSELPTSTLCALRSYNSSVEHAEQLSELLRGKNVMVNLIPWNAVAEREFSAPSGNAVHRFQDVLIKNGIHTRIRRERGTDIGSACGQLRLNSKNQKQ